MHSLRILLAGVVLVGVATILLWGAGGGSGDAGQSPAPVGHPKGTNSSTLNGETGESAQSRERVDLSRLELTVIDDRFNVPVAGARVVCTVEEGGSETKITGESLGLGRIAVDSVPRGSEVQLVILADGYRQKRLSHHAASATEVVRVRLSGSLVVRGQVRSTATKQPLPQVDVMAEGVLGDVVVRTGSEGRYELTGLAPGTYEILARKQGYADGVAVVSVRESQVLDLELKPRNMVDLSVVTGAGQGGGAALLYLVVHADGAVEWEGFARFQDGLGLVRVPIEESMETMHVTVHLPTGHNVTVSAPIVEFRGTRTAMARLRSQWVRFRLKSRDGLVSRTSVQFQAGAESHLLTTDGVGAVRLPLARLAGKSVVFWTGNMLSGSIAVHDASEDIVVHLEARDGGILVAGAQKIGCSPKEIGIRSVFGATGFPRVGTDSGVRFAVPGGGRYFATVRGVTAHDVPLVRGGEDVTLDLTTVGHGVVVGRGFGAGTVRLWKKERKGWVAAFAAVVGADGAFEMPFVFTGEYVLGGATGIPLTRFLVQEGQRVEIDKRELEPRQWKLRVRNGRQMPVVDEEVIVRSEIGSPPERRTTDHHGEVSLRVRRARDVLRVDVGGETFVVEVKTAASETTLVLSAAGGPWWELGPGIGPVRRILVVRQQRHGYSIKQAARRGKKYRIRKGSTLVLAQTLGGYQPIAVDHADKSLQLPEPIFARAPVDAVAYVGSAAGHDFYSERWEVPSTRTGGSVSVRVPSGVSVVLESEGQEWRRKWRREIR